MIFFTHQVHWRALSKPERNGRGHKIDHTETLFLIIVDPCAHEKL